jgi:RNA polymerase sigma-70 factor (ECF subfamily)
MKTKDDYDLIQCCIKGNQDAFTEIVSRYKNLVYSIILRMVNDHEEANDLAQEVFIKVYKNLDKYSPEFKFSTWIMRITTNLVIDYRRKRKQDTVPIDDMDYEIASADTPEDSYIQKEQENIVNIAIKDLPDMYRIPIILYHQQDLSYQEIGDIIGEPLSKVKNRIFRGRKMLKEKLMEMKGGKVL